MDFSHTSERRKIIGLYFLPAKVLAAVTAGILTLCPLLPISTIRLVLYVIFSGLPLLMMVQRRWPIGALLLAIASASLAEWSLAAPIAFTLHCVWVLPWLPAVVAWISFLCVRNKTLVITSTITDGIALFAGATMALMVLGFTIMNGPIPGGSFYASTAVKHDLFYMLSLTEMSAVNHALPTEGPFLPHSMNAYPAWMHAGLGALSLQNKGPAAVSLWPILPLLVLGTGLIVYCLCLRAPSLRLRGWHFSLIAVVMLFLGVRIDLFAFPHTQSLVFPIFFLFQYLLGSDRFQRLPLPEAAGAIILLLLLCLSHTVTGIAALAFFIQSLLGWKKWRHRTLLRCAGWVTVLVCVILIAVLSRRPFHPSAGSRINLESLTYVFYVWRGWILVLGISCAVALLGKWPRIKWFVPISLAILGIGYGLSSVTAKEAFPSIFTGFNSVRFFHFALLGLLPSFLSFPALPGCLLLISLIPVLPKVQNVTSAYFDKPEEISPGMQAAYQFIRERTPPTSRALPEDNFHATAAFTGRPAFERFETNLYSYGMLSEEDFTSKTALADEVFKSGTAPSIRLDAVRSLDLDQVILVRHSRESALAFGLRVNNFLPPAEAKVIFQNDAVAVLQLHKR